MKIYTKTGDDGSTGLQGNLRIDKSHPRIVSYGTIDEVNASLGIVLTNSLDADIINLLTKIQNDLFLLGSDLSNPNLNDIKNRVSLEMITNLEQNIDKFELESIDTLSIHPCLEIFLRFTTVLKKSIIIIT